MAVAAGLAPEPLQVLLDRREILNGEAISLPLPAVLHLVQLAEAVAALAARETF